MSFIKTYISSIENVSDFQKKANEEYFKALYKKFQNPESLDLVINQPEKGINSNIIPVCLANSQDLKDIDIQKYSELTTMSSKLKDYKLTLVKMHAGLGSSVKRSDLLEKYANGRVAGSKGTDLFIEINGRAYSLAQLQFKQVEILRSQKLYSAVDLINLVNQENIEAVEKVSQEFVEKFDHIMQLKLPTVLDGELSSERVAPGGHAYLGYSLLHQIFDERNCFEEKNEIISIGNGEDLNSSADPKMISWMIDKDIPICMITTTKLAKDKKGGQISIVRSSEGKYVTIIEKAQAEKANQLEYFEQLGLREEDGESLFNTNIVLINKSSLSKLFKKHLKELGKDEFSDIITPDLIKNIKEQNGKSFIQLEGAIGSSLLNLDQYFRLKFNKGLISFLNLNPIEREHFFIPIKKRSDFDELLEKYEYNINTGRFDLKSK